MGKSSTGRHGGTEYRVYHGGMAPDTSTLPRPPTPSARPEPAATGPAATAATTAPRAPGASETATLAVADSAAPPAAEAPPDLNQLGNRIAVLSARIQAATYELLCDLREFDRHHGWEGFRSCAHWLNWRTGLDLGAAREKLRVAAALADLNHLSAAMACGRLDGREFMEVAPRLALWPGLALTITVYSLNMFGDAVRDLLDPRSRGASGVRGRIGRLGADRSRKPSRNGSSGFRVGSAGGRVGRPS